jgi:hypothetical protein
MTKKIAFCLALLGLFGLSQGAVAEIGTIDDVPAATLLLPYFEVDLDNPNGATTLFSVNNASAAPALAHVTLWTDLSVPVLDFDIYLTGYDVQTLNLRDVMNGILPQTLDANSDIGDAVSNDGNPGAKGDPLDGSFPGTSGPCVTTYGPLGSSFVNTHLQPALTGGNSSIVGVAALNYGDNVARGYVTVDSTSQCSLDFPSAGDDYFINVANTNNILFGDYFYVFPGDNFAQGETLVHIEACSAPSVGEGEECPFTGDPTAFTFYSRYVGTFGIDEREGLASQFAARYTLGTPFDGTDLVIWRDSRSTDIVGPTFDWFPLNQNLVVAFDEEENNEELCFLESDVSPPTGGQQTCFPAETGRYGVALSNVPGSQTLDPSFNFGWLCLDLDLSASQPSQAWVTVVMSAEGRFSVGFDAIQLDNVTTTALVTAP